MFTHIPVPALRYIGRMSPVCEFIRRYDGDQRAVLDYFHRYLTEELELTDKVRWNIPFYYHYSWICYLNPTKDDRVELAFLRGRELSSEQGLLNFRERKQIAGVIFGSVGDIPEEAVRQVIQEALIVDETPYRVKRR